MGKLLIITQRVDTADDLLGFFNDWIGEFANNFEKVFVITLAKGDYHLPSNVEVFSLGKERSTSKMAQYLKFYWLLFKYIPKSSGIFAHMSPIFAIAAWPISVIFRKKIILWYLHRSVTPRLKIAEKLVNKIVTASQDSLMLKSSKVVEVGHGINIDLFKSERSWSSGRLNILSVGRISPIKGFETLIRAVKEISKTNNGINLKIVGRPIQSGDSEYLKKLEDLVSDLDLKNLVQFAGFKAYKEMPEIYSRADLSVNLAPRGGIDKVVLESMASGLLVLTSNEAFSKYFGEHSSRLIFGHNNSSDLIAKINYLITLSAEEKDLLSKFLINAVREHHRLDNAIKKISNLFL